MTPLFLNPTTKVAGFKKYLIDFPLLITRSFQLITQISVVATIHPKSEIQLGSYTTQN